jgi:hypothetical protein
LVATLWIKFSVIVYSTPSIIITIFFFETGSHYAAQAGLKLENLLPQPPCWNHRVHHHLSSYL